jgi:hypothetical protein
MKLYGLVKKPLFVATASAVLVFSSYFADSKNNIYKNINQKKEPMASIEMKSKRAHPLTDSSISKADTAKALDTLSVTPKKAQAVLDSTASKTDSTLNSQKADLSIVPSIQSQNLQNQPKAQQAPAKKKHKIKLPKEVQDFLDKTKKQSYQEAVKEAKEFRWNNGHCNSRAWDALYSYEGIYNSVARDILNEAYPKQNKQEIHKSLAGDLRDFGVLVAYRQYRLNMIRSDLWDRETMKALKQKKSTKNIYIPPYPPKGTNILFFFPDLMPSFRDILKKYGCDRLPKEKQLKYANILVKEAITYLRTIVEERALYNLRKALGG